MYKLRFISQYQVTRITRNIHVTFFFCKYQRIFIRITTLFVIDHPCIFHALSFNYFILRSLIGAMKIEYLSNLVGLKRGFFLFLFIFIYINYSVLNSYCNRKIRGKRTSSCVVFFPPFPVQDLFSDLLLQFVRFVLSQRLEYREDISIIKSTNHRIRQNNDTEGRRF